jgi:hypothetical protein
MLAILPDQAASRVIIRSNGMTAPHDFPGTREDVLEEIRASRAEVEAIIDNLSEKQMTQSTDDGGWSIKDHLAHITAWQQHGLAVINGHQPYEAIGVDQETYESLDMHGINEIIYKRNRDRSLSDVMSDFNRTHTKVLAAIERMNDDELQQEITTRYTHAPRTIADLALGHFAGHDNDHVEDIRALANQHVD